MATISGTVIFDRDRSATISDGDSRLANISVILQNINTTERLTVLTDSNGNYTFLNVPNGDFRIVQAYGTPGGVPTPGDFLTAAAGSIPQGVNPPINIVPNPPSGSTNLDSVTPNTLLVTVAGADLSDQNFFNGPVIYTPIQSVLDPCSIVSGNNLIEAADNGTIGTFPQGTQANTGSPTEPYPGIAPNFTYVLPNSAVVTPLAGEYTVQNIMNDSSNAKLGTWWRIADHTTGNETGRMMVVNGFKPNTVFFRAEVSVQPNTNYLFTAWILNLYKVNGYPDPELGVRIFDQNNHVLYSATLGTLLPINVNVPEWKQIGTAINSQDNTSLAVEFINEGPEVTGRGYAIDDVSFREIQIPDFVPVKTVDSTTANVGETVTYTVTLANTCNRPLTDLLFKDTIPNGLSFVPNSVIINGTTSPGADPNVGFALLDIPGGETVTVTLQALVEAIPVPNPALNRALIKYFYTPVAGGIPGIYEVYSNEVPLAVGTLADISVVKTDSSSPAKPGAELNYNITVSNVGPSPAVNTFLTDDIPSQLTNAQFSIDGGLTFLPWTGSYMMGTLAVDDSVKIIIRGTLSSLATGEIVNTAVVSSDTPDPNPDNNTSTVRTPVLPSADISIVKTASPSPVMAGEVLTYTLLISNAGPSTAVNVNLTDMIPDGLINAKFSTDGGGVWSPFNGFVFLGNVEPGQFRQILLRAAVSETTTGNLTNTAKVDSGTLDPNPDNNTSTVVTPVIPVENSADLSIIKTSSPNPVQRGEELVYTLNISNAGPSAAVNTILTDRIPPALTNAEFSLNGGLTWQTWSGAFNLGTLAALSSITVLIHGTVSPSSIGSIVNTGTVSSDTPDPDPSNNTDTNTTVIASTAVADISVMKSGRPATVSPGETLTYTVTVTNHGPDSAENIILYDEIPPELTKVQFSTDGGVTWNMWINPYNLGLLPNGQSRTILIRGTVVESACGIIFYNAVVKSDTQDPNPHNNTSSENTPIKAGKGADLSIGKTAYPNPATRYNKLNYTLTVFNAGPETAEQVVVCDELPNVLDTPVYSLDNGQTYHPWTGNLNIGNLEPDKSITIIISGVVNGCAKGYIKNTATVSSVTHDPYLCNNRDCVNVKVCNCQKG